MVLCPERYPEASPLELLEAAAQGKAALDQRWLCALLDRPADTVAAIVEFLSRDRSCDRIDLEEELILLARQLKASELVPFLMDRVRRYAEDIPELLFETVASYGELVWEPLLNLYRELGPKRAGDVAFLLVSLGLVRPEIDQILSELEQLDREEAEFCRQVYEQVRQGERQPESEDWDLWSRFPEKDDPPFETLPYEERIEFFACESAETREAAARSLFNISELPPAVIKKLIQVAREDPDPRVRAAAWRSLSLEAERFRLVDGMLERLKDPATPAVEKGGLIVALVDKVTDPRVRRFVIELYDQPEARAYALEAMWRSLDLRFARFMIEHLQDPDPQIREQAILGAGYLGAVAALPQIERAIDDDRFRHAALVAYSLLAPMELTPEGARKLFEEIDERAGGLSVDEADLVREAIDSRMILHRKRPVFSVD